MNSSVPAASIISLRSNVACTRRNRIQGWIATNSRNARTMRNSPDPTNLGKYRTPRPTITSTVIGIARSGCDRKMTARPAIARMR